MFNFIHLQLKLKWGFNKNNNKASAIMTAIAAFLAIALILALVWALTFVLRANIRVTPKALAQMYITLVLAGLTVFATSMQINRLYKPGDLLITARFPLSPFKIFVSYLILNYLDLFIYSALLLLPVMVVFGVAMNCLSVIYMLGVLLGLLFMPIVPFALSIFIAIPIMYAISLLERHGIVRLVMFVIFLAGCFVLYNYILTVLAQFFIHRNWETGTLEIWENVIAALDTYYNPGYYIGNIIFVEEYWLGLGVVIGGGLVLSVIGVLVAKLVYTKVRNKVLEGAHLYERHSKVDDYSSARAIFRYSFKEILRTKTYSYFYLGVAISTPVMVFFCNRLVSLVGEAQIGAGINFGVAMLVISVFMAMISSFTASILSVEGKTFYITKLVPVRYRKQLMIKGCLNIGVSAVALAISAIITGVLQFINAVEMTVLVCTEIFLIIGFVFNGINLNLANPNLKLKANGDPEEINITYMLMIGLVIAAIIGAGCIILPGSFEHGNLLAYGGSEAIALIYALINVLVYWFTVDKRYKKIEA